MWTVVVEPCPGCGAREKHPFKEDEEIIESSCYKCGTIFTITREGDIECTDKRMTRDSYTAKTVD